MDTVDKEDMMDLNLFVAAGRLAADPETTTFSSGARLTRVLLTVRTEGSNRRIDVLPIVMWDTPDDHPIHEAQRGSGLWVAGAVQRRFWSAEAGRTSRVEIMAHEMQPRVEEVMADGNER